MIFRKIISFFVDTIQTFVVAGAIFVISYLFFLQPHQVIGDSMLPNFHDKEYVLTDKISYRFRNPKREEVIIFRAPNNPEKDYIKRIIGEPGKTVKIEDGKVFINNEALDETPYLPNSVKTFAGAIITKAVEYQVPKDSYFVLGDNRENSSDSREWGFIKRSDIIGRSLLVYWPTSSFRLIKLDKSF